MELFLTLIHCLPHRIIFSGVLYCFLNHLLYSRSLGLVSLDCFPACPLEDWVCTAFYTHLQFCGRVSGVNFGPFYLSQFNPCGEVCTAHRGESVTLNSLNPCGEVCTAHRGESVTLNSLNSNFEHHLECDSDFLSLLNLFCSHCQNGQSVVAYIGFNHNEF